MGVNRERFPIMRIAIFGQYKTGTTGLFQAIRNACAPEVRCLFEPAGFTELPTDHRTGVLAKVIFDCPGLVEFKGFEKKVLIVRDPRDWLVSGILFIPQQRREIYGNPRAVDQVLRLLRQKEESPCSVPMVDVLRAILGHLSEREREEWPDFVRRHLEFTTEFDRALENGLTIKYEDFVEGRIAKLERYLRLDLDHRVEMPPEHEHVPRTLGYGNWRTWFTEEDVRIFRPLVSQFMTSAGYSDDWKLEQVGGLAASHGSQYVERTVGMRLSRRAGGS